MKKIKSNYDIICENQKKQIVFNIFPDIISEEFISYPKDNINNNDTLNFVSKIFEFLESNIYSFCQYFLNSMKSFNRTFYKIQYIFLIMTLLFTFVYSFEDNSNISTNLIVSAYFPNCSHLTHILYENVQKSFNKTQKKIINIKKKEINNNKNNLIDCESGRINEDLKSFMSSSANTKNTYVNYEKKSNKIIINKGDDFHSFFINSVKSSTFSMVSFFALYYFIKLTYTSKFRSFLIFNIFFMYIVYNVTNSLYKNNYFLSSTFMFVLLIYLFKSLIDSIFLLLKYRKKDFEIFSTNLTAINCKQFLLKFVILSLATIISGFMSISYYKLCLNYIIFYLCLLTLMVFLCNCLEPFSPPYLKPIKNILMFIVGLINFIICKFYFLSNNSAFDIDTREMFFIGHEEEDRSESSLYLVSDLFSLFCFDYLREYINIQIDDNFQFHKKLTKKDLIIISFFLSSFGVGIVGIIKNEYICFILSIYITKISSSYFIKIFKTKISRLINHVTFIFYIFFLLKMSYNRDVFLLNYFSFTKMDSEVLSDIFRFLNFLILIYYGCDKYHSLYFSNVSFNNDDLKELPEEQVNKILEFTSNISKQKLKNLKIQIIHDNNKYKLNNIIYLSIDLCLLHLLICIIFVVLGEDEINMFCKLLFSFLFFISNSIKFNVFNEIQNNIEYILTYLVGFMLNCRLSILSRQTSKIIYFMCQINLLLVIISYSINDKKNRLVSIIIIFHLFYQLSKINSIFLIIDLIALIISPLCIEYLSKKTNDISQSMKIDKTINLSLLFLLVLVIFLVQLYGIYNYNKIISYFNIRQNEYEDEINDFMYSDLNENKNQRKTIDIEYIIINGIYSLLKIKQ